MQRLTKRFICHRSGMWKLLKTNFLYDPEFQLHRTVPAYFKAIHKTQFRLTEECSVRFWTARRRNRNILVEMQNAWKAWKCVWVLWGTQIFLGLWWFKLLTFIVFCNFFWCFIVFINIMINLWLIITLIVLVYFYKNCNLFIFTNNYSNHCYKHILMILSRFRKNDLNMFYKSFDIIACYENAVNFSRNCKTLKCWKYEK